MFKRAITAVTAPVLLVVLSLTGGCAKRDTQPAGSQTTAQPPQATTPSTVEQPDSGGPILADEANAMSGREVGPADEGPLNRIHFDYDSWTVNTDAATTLRRNAEYLKTNPNTYVRIEGHCDDRGSVEYNIALGERRANSAKEHLASLGIDPKRMETISYGEDRPISFENTEYGWALNRRAEFRILNE